MNQTPRGMRPHIVLAGPCNAGKSSLLNALTGTTTALVSEHRGTTTDPVYKNMELLPFGPVTFIDTPGLDDKGVLGGLRAERGRNTLTQGDILVLVIRPSLWLPDFMTELEKSSAPVLVVFTHQDLPEEQEIAREVKAGLADLPAAEVSSLTGRGIPELRESLIRILSSLKNSTAPLLADLVRPGALIVMVVPIDLEAPAGRLILPQVQAIREALDSDTAILVVKERELDYSFSLLSRKPDLVICDSQVVLKVAASTPEDIPLTTFSILLSRQKGDLASMVMAARSIRNLKDGSRVLLAETCTHKTLCDDIGRVKIPRWLRQASGAELEIDHCGGTFPKNLGDYDLVIHCGGCMITRTMMLGRLGLAKDARILITNYGLAISQCQGVLERVVRPFSELSQTVPRELET